MDSLGLGTRLPEATDIIQWWKELLKNQLRCQPRGIPSAAGALFKKMCIYSESEISAWYYFSNNLICTQIGLETKGRRKSD